MCVLFAGRRNSDIVMEKLSFWANIASLFTMQVLVTDTFHAAWSSHSSWIEKKCNIVLSSISISTTLCRIRSVWKHYSNYIFLIPMKLFCTLLGLQNQLPRYENSMCNIQCICIIYISVCAFTITTNHWVSWNSSLFPQ